MRDFDSIEDLTPTKGFRNRTYNFLGLDISEWELGGQKVYRKQYLSNQADLVFGGTEFVVFLIDIQDINRYEEALEYLKDIIEQLEKLDLFPPVYVFFHKFDPPEMIGSQAEITNRSLELRNRIKNEINYDKFKFYRTSIYNLQTIILAISNILLSKNPKSAVIEQSIKEYAERLDLLSLVLIDDNSLLIGTYYFNNYIEDLMSAVTPFFLEVNELFERATVNKRFAEEGDQEEEMMVRRFGKYFFFKKFQIKKEGSFFYFLGCKNDPNFKSDEFDMFVNVIKQIL